MTNRRRTSQSNNQVYVYGNTVRQMEPETALFGRNKEKTEARKNKKVSAQVRRNRRRAFSVSSTYVTFLGIAAIIALLVSFRYLQLRNQVDASAKEVVSMQKELAERKEDNETRYNSVMDSMNLNEVREKAIRDLGMVYVSPEQVIHYHNSSEEYVKKYDNIPVDGVLPGTGKK